MALVLQNNIPAMQAVNTLTANISALGKALKKASTGQRINSAGDGASEYAIGARMDAMVRSLAQDKINSETGRNIVAVAEGGIQEIINNMRSMKELAINSANDTNTDIDRATIEKEFSSRMETIADIAATTNYNGKLLLNGDYYEPRDRKITVKPSTGDSGSTVTTDAVTGLFSLPTGTMAKSGEVAWANGLTAYRSGNTTNLDFTGAAINGSPATIADMDQAGFVLLCGVSGCSAYTGFKFDASLPSGTGLMVEAGGNKKTYVVGIGGLNSLSELPAALFDGVKDIVGGTDTLVSLPDRHEPKITKNGDSYTLGYGYSSLWIYEGLAPDTPSPTPGPNPGPLPEPYSYNVRDMGKPLIIHTGPKSNQCIPVYINSMSPIAMGLNKASVVTREKAVESLGIVDHAIEYALNEATRMGAYQMRLEATSDNIVISEENTTASKSTILDADMAKTMEEFHRQNVLTQSAQMMLAQANQNPSRVLSLLQ